MTQLADSCILANVFECNAQTMLSVCKASDQQTQGRVFM
jgi:hypothetical protein